jgi:hypothetical protein
MKNISSATSFSPEVHTNLNISPASEGNTNIILLQGLQVLPVRASDNDRMGVKTLG